MPVFRTGIGFDAHRFAASGTRRSLWLACFRWTDDESRGIEGLEGDSDGDVAAHAAIDALLSESEKTAAPRDVREVSCFLRLPIMSQNTAGKQKTFRFRLSETVPAYPLIATKRQRL